MNRHTFLLACLVVGISLCRLPAADEIDITQFGSRFGEKPTPITISGFTGEVRQTLEFDLYVMGFEITNSDSAPYAVSGSNGARLEAKVIDRLGGGKTLLSKAYSGGDARTLAHALADDVVRVTVNREGIARTKIAFRSREGGPRSFEIYVSDYDGRNARRATNDKAVVAAPDWVPGKFALVYSSYRNTFPDILLHDLGSGKRQVLANYPGSNMTPAVSPDGKKVAMILSRSGNPELWVANLDGTELKQLTRTKQTESSPTWSPDSRTICFVSDRSGKNGMYLVSVDGGAPRRLSVVGVGNLTEPDWSPDGKWIAFTRQAGNFEICVVPAAGGTAEILVTGEDPSWAPNSRNLIYTRGQNRLSVLDVPTKQTKDIQQISGFNSQGAWAR